LRGGIAFRRNGIVNIARAARGEIALAYDGVAAKIDVARAAAASGEEGRKSNNENIMKMKAKIISAISAA
jgi:hypothetical protein